MQFMEVPTKNLTEGASTEEILFYYTIQRESNLI